MCSLTEECTPLGGGGGGGGGVKEIKNAVLLNFILVKES